MQNPGQTWIFYKAGQTRLTQTKRDPDDLDYPDDPTQFSTLNMGIASHNKVASNCMEQNYLSFDKLENFDEE